MTEPCSCPQCRHERSPSHATLILFGSELLEVAEAHPGHGDWPLYPPGRFRGEEFKLYEQIAGPLEPCGPDCDAMCVCDTEPDEEED